MPLGDASAQVEALLLDQAMLLDQDRPAGAAADARPDLQVGPVEFLPQLAASGCQVGLTGSRVGPPQGRW